MTQLSFYDRFTPLAPAALPRLNRQCAAILARLRRGTASNRELAELSMKYTGRISDLRHAGYDIRCTTQDRRTGVCWYELREP